MPAAVQLFTEAQPHKTTSAKFGAVAWCVADINGDGRDEVIQIWEASDGNAWATVCVTDHNDGLTRSWRGSLEVKAKAITWQVADLNGDGRDEIVQLRDKDGRLAAMIFGGGENNSLEKLSTNDDLYQGSTAMKGSLGWLSGSFSANKE